MALHRLYLYGGTVPTSALDLDFTKQELYETNTSGAAILIFLKINFGIPSMHEKQQH